MRCFFLAILLFPLFSLAQSDISCGELEFRNYVVHYPGVSLPFNGTCSIHSDDGKLKKQIDYQDGIKRISREYDSEEQIFVEVEYNQSAKVQKFKNYQGGILFRTGGHMFDTIEFRPVNEGLFQYYNPAGTVYRREIYHYGKLLFTETSRGWKRGNITCLDVGKVAKEESPDSTVFNGKLSIMYDQSTDSLIFTTPASTSNQPENSVKTQQLGWLFIFENEQADSKLNREEQLSKAQKYFGVKTEAGLKKEVRNYINLLTDAQ